MTVWLKAHERQLYIAASAAALLMFCIYVLLVFFIGSGFMGVGPASPARMLDGTAIRPHAYRQLVPLITHIVMAFTPDAVEQSISHHAYDWFWSHPMISQPAIHYQGRLDSLPELEDPAGFFPLVVMLAVDAVFLLAFLWVMWKLAVRIFPDLWTAQLLAPWMAILPLPAFCSRYGFPYDIPVLFFCAWLTLLLVEKRLDWFFLGFVLATLNKETSIYLMLLFALYGYHTLTHREWSRWLALQAISFAVIKTALTLRYAGNGGDFLALLGPTHIAFMRFGYTGFGPLAIVVLLALLGYAWKEKPLILKCWMALFPLMLLAFGIFGNRGEYRVLYEIFPCFALLSAHTIARLWQTPAR